MNTPPPKPAARQLETLPQQEQLHRAPARFGNTPADASPKGRNRRQGFRKLHPRIDLPAQITERVKLDNPEPHEPNRLIWGRRPPRHAADPIQPHQPLLHKRAVLLRMPTQRSVVGNSDLRFFKRHWKADWPDFSYGSAQHPSPRNETRLEADRIDLCPL